MTRLPLAVLVAVLLVACGSTTPNPTLGPTGEPSQAPTASPAPTTDAPATASPPASDGPPSDVPSVSPTPTPQLSATAGPGGVEGELAAPGTLTACLSVVGAPAAGLTADGQLDGYNVAIAREIADRLGLELVITQPLFADLVEQVAGHACDISVSSQNITDARSQQLAFVPYSRSFQPIVVTIGNPESIDTLGALCGVAVSTTTGTTHVDLVEGGGDYEGQGLNDTCAESNQPPIDLRTYQTELEAVTALLDGEVVAYLGNPSFVLDFPDQIMYSQASLPPARQGIAVALDHPQVLAAVQSALDSMVSDGLYRGILVQYLPNVESVDAVTIEE